MAECIERAAAIDAVSEVYYDTPDVNLSAEKFEAAINAISAADVAPVVRCKDRKWYKESRVLSPNKFCFRLNHPTEPGKIGYNFADDDFCSYGERKDDGVT